MARWTVSAELDAAEGDVTRYAAALRAVATAALGALTGRTRSAETGILSWP